MTLAEETTRTHLSECWRSSALPAELHQHAHGGAGCLCETADVGPQEPTRRKLGQALFTTVRDYCVLTRHTRGSSRPLDQRTNSWVGAGVYTTHSASWMPLVSCTSWRTSYRQAPNWCGIHGAALSHWNSLDLGTSVEAPGAQGDTRNAEQTRCAWQAKLPAAETSGHFESTL